MTSAQGHESHKDGKLKTDREEATVMVHSSRDRDYKRGQASIDRILTSLLEPRMARVLSMSKGLSQRCP